ncbi:hypothetical protein [Novosphingobium album (ex Hu et al. 2023)]|nr:hypothetical protein [Novosphingobium album (ex Hu et al. 2023)]
MRWSRDGVMLPTCILEAATFQQSVQLTCRCGHTGRFEAHGLWWHFERRGWDDRFAAARPRFWCRVCASRERRKVHPDRLEAVPWQQGDVELPWPEERRWKQATARLR